MSGTLLYDRKIAITVKEAIVSGPAIDKAIVYPSDRFPPIRELKVKFDIEKAIKEPNRATVEIYNLSAVRRNVIAKNDRLILAAGYAAQEDSLPTLFKGGVSFLSNKKTRTDWITTLECGDGIAAHRGAILKESFVAGTTFQQVLDKCKTVLTTKWDQVWPTLSDTSAAALISEALLTSDPTTEGTTGSTIFAKGKAIFDTVGNVASEIIEQIGGSLGIQNETVIIVKVGEGYGDPILLNPDTGLIGSPEKIDKGGVKVRSLLITEIEPHRILRLTSSTANGDYVVARATYSGDNYGPEWYIDSEAYPPGTRISA